MHAAAVNSGQAALGLLLLKLLLCSDQPVSHGPLPPAPLRHRQQVCGAASTTSTRPVSTTTFPYQQADLVSISHPAHHVGRAAAYPPCRDIRWRQ